jgi:uncharacterized membrane protein
MVTIEGFCVGKKYVSWRWFVFCAVILCNKFDVNEQLQQRIRDNWTVSTVNLTSLTVTQNTHKNGVQAKRQCVILTASECVALKQISTTDYKGTAVCSRRNKIANLAVCMFEFCKGYAVGHSIQCVQWVSWRTMAADLSEERGKEGWPTIARRVSEVLKDSSSRRRQVWFKKPGPIQDGG